MVVRFVVTGLSAAAGAAAMYAGLQAGGSTPGGPGWPPPPSPAHPAAAAAAAAAAAHQLANSIYAAPPPPPHPSAPAPHDLAHHMSWSVIPATKFNSTPPDSNPNFYLTLNPNHHPTHNCNRNLGVMSR